MKQLVIKKKSILWVSLLLTISLFSCTSEKSSKDQYDDVYQNPISISNAKFIDGFGRQLILNGANMMNQDATVNYKGLEGPETYANYKKWGFNVIRLGVFWEGVEPEPGVYDEAYLQELDRQIKMATDNGLFVFLDMHQDLFSIKYKDGAPEWATMDEGKPHIEGAVWSDSYMISPAVHASFDNFWKNATAPDGVGLQDHYANAWKHIVKRYANNNTVIGIDIMNEPFAGSEAQLFMPYMFGAFAQIIAEETGKEMSIEEVAMLWSDSKTRYEALAQVSTKEKWGKVVDAVYELNSKFESGPLQAFYQKVADAVRQVDTTKILFFNHSYFCNSGVSTALKPFKLSNGSVDPLVAYAAHAYDLVVDTDNLSNSSSDRLELIFERIYESGKRMNVPVIIGEWGALDDTSPGLGVGFTNLAHTHLKIFEKYLFSNTYWAYRLGAEKKSFFKDAIVRPYPMLISGKLIAYNYDIDSGVFTCKWEENKELNAPTKIFIPNLGQVSVEDITIEPEEKDIKIEQIENSHSGYLIIQALNKNITREISFVIGKNCKH